MINKFIDERKSTRLFDNLQKIEKEDVLECIASAMRAPSSKNEQPWRFRMISNEDFILKLSEQSKINSWVKRASLVVIVYRYGEMQGRKKDYLAIGAAIENLLLEAESRNIGTCWIGSDDAMNFVSQCPEALNENCEPVAIIAMGHGISRFNKRTPRVNLEEVLV